MWIDVITPEHAEGDLADFYDAVGKARGGVARVHQIQSLNLKAMKAHLELYKAVLFQRSSLSRIQRERIAVVVSHGNQCAYCIAHHAEALRNLKDDERTVSQLAEGAIADSLPTSDKLLLAWVRARTLEPGAASEQDITSLKDAGFDDRAILDATLTMGYFNFVNRLVLSLGVHLEDDFEETCAPDMRE